MGGWGGHFILQGGNDCDGRERKTGREERERDADGGQQTKENRKEKKREKNEKQPSK